MLWESVHVFSIAVKMFIFLWKPEQRRHASPLTSPSPTDRSLVPLIWIWLWLLWYIKYCDISNTPCPISNIAIWPLRLETTLNRSSWTIERRFQKKTPEPDPKKPPEPRRSLTAWQLDNDNWKKIPEKNDLNPGGAWQLDSLTMTIERRSRKKRPEPRWSLTAWQWRLKEDPWKTYLNPGGCVCSSVRSAAVLSSVTPAAVDPWVVLCLNGERQD